MNESYPLVFGEELDKQDDQSYPLVLDEELVEKPNKQDDQSYPLVLGEELNKQDFTEFEFSEPEFLLQNSKLLHLKEVNYYVLNFLVSSILRKPTNLLIHLQRITLCHKQKNEEKLYAAVVDFFIVLQGSGMSLKQRMLAGCRNQLSPILFQRLQIYLTDYQLIQGNIYTVLTLGIESNIELVVEQLDNKSTLDCDPLQIAQDFIEYEQQDDAREVLETAIMTDPDNTELHLELLQLYISTDNSDAFHKMQSVLSDINHSMQPQWDELNAYFTQ